MIPFTFLLRDVKCRETGRWRTFAASLAVAGAILAICAIYGVVGG